jgi:hypothetical protein
VGAGETHDIRQRPPALWSCSDHPPSTYRVAEEHPLWACSAPIGRVRKGERRKSIGGPDQPETVALASAAAHRAGVGPRPVALMLLGQTRARYADPIDVGSRRQHAQHRGLLTSFVRGNQGAAVTGVLLHRTERHLIPALRLVPRRRRVAGRRGITVLSRRRWRCLSAILTATADRPPPPASTAARPRPASGIGLAGEVSRNSTTCSPRKRFS